MIYTKTSFTQTFNVLNTHTHTQVRWCLSFRRSFLPLVGIEW